MFINMGTFPLFILVLIIGASSSTYLPDNGSLKDAGGNINMINLGNVDGKSYFVDNTTSISWLESRDLCRQYGMELATITTESQFAFLKSKYNTTTFGMNYWIAARDSRQLRALSWDDTNLEIGPLPTNVHYTQRYSRFLLCGMYYCSFNTQTIYGHPCSDVYSDVGTLCET